MRRLLPVLAAVVLAAAVCVPVDAQSRRMRTRVVSAPPGTQVIRTAGDGATSAPVAVTQPGRVLSGNSVDQLLNGGYPAPGLGFDYTHHAAINRNLDKMALVDPVTQQRLAQQRQRGRNVPVAPAFPVVVNTVVVNVAPQPPVVIIQEPEPEPEYVQQARFIERMERAAPAEPAFFYEPPQRESEEMVLVRRDGSLLFAVAFTARPDAAGQGAHIIYITREGHRRSVALAELDLDATRDLNEARGTTLHLQ